MQELERAPFYENYSEQLENIEMDENGIRDFRAYEMGSDVSGFVFVEYCDQTALYTYNDGGPYFQEFYPTLEEAIDAAKNEYT